MIAQYFRKENTGNLLLLGYVFGLTMILHLIGETHIADMPVSIFPHHRSFDSIFFFILFFVRKKGLLNQFTNETDLLCIYLESFRIRYLPT